MRKYTKKDIEKIEELRELANIPYNMGEQFININLNLVWGFAGTINYGLNWKCEMGEYDFRSLEEATEIVKRLRERANESLNV